MHHGHGRLHHLVTLVQVPLAIFSPAMSQLSGLQRSILSLYRACIRELGKKKDPVRPLLSMKASN